MRSRKIILGVLILLLLVGHAVVMLARLDFEADGSSEYYYIWGESVGLVFGIPLGATFAEIAMTRKKSPSVIRRLLVVTLALFAGLVIATVSFDHRDRAGYTSTEPLIREYVEDCTRRCLQDAPEESTACAEVCECTGRGLIEGRRRSETSDLVRRVRARQDEAVDEMQRLAQDCATELGYLPGPS
jgi:hypothetical protein